MHWYSLHMQMTNCRVSNNHCIALLSSARLITLFLDLYMLKFNICTDGLILIQELLPLHCWIKIIAHTINTYIHQRMHAYCTVHICGVCKVYISLYVRIFLLLTNVYGHVYRAEINIGSTVECNLSIILGSIKKLQWTKYNFTDVHGLRPACLHLNIHYLYKYICIYVWFPYLTEWYMHIKTFTSYAEFDFVVCSTIRKRTLFYCPLHGFWLFVMYYFMNLTLCDVQWHGMAWNRVLHEYYSTGSNPTLCGVLFHGIWPWDVAHCIESD